MEATSTANGVVQEDVFVAPGSAPALRNLFDRLKEYAGAKLSHQADKWLGDLDQAMASAGPRARGAYEAIKAHLLGNNPVWAGIKGAWSGASWPVRLAVVLLLVLLLLLSPVALLLLILGLLIAAIIAAVRSATA